MELTCALVLALAALVSGNPSGYGVKGGGGAVAKAEANAAAFAGSGALSKTIPSPTDAAISGSYSKSLASNFASSASSAYSSSFSFSGSGVKPEEADEPLSGNSKCKSGGCSTGIQDTGNGPVSSGASAISAAGVKSYAGSPGKVPCASGDCHKSPNCQGANCDSGSAPTGPDSDDIAFNIAGSAAKTTNGDKTHYSGFGCSNGKCDSSKPSDENEAPDRYPNSPAQPTNKPASYLTVPTQGQPCSSPNCKNDIYDKNRPSSYNVPILAPDTPSEANSPNDCAAGNCPNYPLKNTPDILPSNIKAAVPSFVSASSSCSSPNCAGPSSPSSPGSLLAKYPHTQPSQPSYNSASASSVINPISTSYDAPKTNVPSVSLPNNKKSLPYTGGFGGPPGILKPNEFNVPSKILSYKPTAPTNADQPKTPTESYQPPPCSSGNCASQPIPVSPQYDTGGKYKPSAPGPYNPSTCTSGICGSYPGQPTPNDYSAPSVVSASYPAGSYNPNPTTAPCSNGICGSQPGKPSPQYNPTNPSFAYKPTLPASGFGGPSGVLKPNDYNAPSNKPTSNPAGPNNPTAAPCSNGICGSPGQTPPQYYPSPEYKPSAPGFGAPGSKPAGSFNPGATPCSTGICGSQPGQSPTSTYKPSAPNSGLGGPAAVIKPNPHDNPYNEPNSKPTESYESNTASCSGGICGPQPEQSPQYNPSPVYKPSAPGFSGPSGILKPNDYNAPPSNPSAGPYKPTSAPCSTGNCGSQPGQSSPQYYPSPVNKPSSPGFGGPIGILKPNEYNAPPTPNPTGPYQPTTAPCSTGNCGSQPGQSSPQYYPSPVNKPSPPGFGGPSGILKPNDYNTPPSNPAGPYKPTAAPCSTGHCGSQPGQSLPQYNPSPAYKPSAPGFGGPSGILKPNDYNAPLTSNPAGPYKPTTAPCSTGNCGSQPGQSSPQYYPSPVNKPSPPGFGGPSGILKPNDYNAPPTSNPTGPYQPTTAPCTTGNCGSQPGQSSPQYNPSPAPPAPGFGGPSGILKPNDYNAPLTSNPAGSYKPTTAPCSSGNCGSQPGQSSSQYNPVPLPPPGFGGRDAPISNPTTACSGGRCESQSGQSSALYNPLPAYKPAVPGFGVPIGVLKPNSYSTPYVVPISNTAAPCSTGVCGSQPSQPSPQYNPSNAYSPITPTSGFSGPKPNDYTAPSNVPNFKPTGPAGTYSPIAAPCSAGNCGQHPIAQSPATFNEYPGYTPNAPGAGFVGSVENSKPNHYGSLPSNVPTSYNSVPCTSGSCGQSPSGPATVTSGSASSYQPSACSTGKCGAYPNYYTQNAGAGAAAGAIASAKAIAYTGGFGGPPGLLKPYDGKAGSGAAAFGKISSGQDDSHGFNGKSVEGANLSSGSGAQASAIAGATAGAYGNGQSDQNIKNTGGCTSGCGGGSNGAGAVAGASAKSVATASAGAYGGNFASSSASAHASAGAATKGGYGR